MDTEIKGHNPEDCYEVGTDFSQISIGKQNMFQEIVTYRDDYRRGFGLDDWIYCTLCIHNSVLQVIQCYR
jgi:hypothetical protein